MFTIICLLFSIYVTEACTVVGDHYTSRTNILECESRMAVGGGINLSPAEAMANDKLMALKYAEVEEGFENPQNMNLSEHYFKYQRHINNSRVYQIIKNMPKGGALHVHSSMMLDADYILQLTYEDHVYVCFADGQIKLLFSDQVPQRPCQSKWELINDVRSSSNDIEVFDKSIKKYFTLYTEDEDLLNADINTVWNRFNRAYASFSSFISYRPVREKYFYDALQRFYDDNIMYVEIRSGLKALYELNGTVHDKTYIARLYNEVANQFKKNHPDFIGVKLIVSVGRQQNDFNKLRQILELAVQVKHELPNLFAGFDLVGQEDLGKPLADFLPILTKYKNELNFYFHAGETNWYGTTSDDNLLDAILLGTKRIGHAYSLIKHPALIELVKQFNIAIEVNVVSNIVLSLVNDVRNHPLASFLAMGLPVVLSSDDPGIWGADPLSHDFYIAFVGVASRRADLRLLKQLALNSLIYSSLDPVHKAKALFIFQKKWDSFIHELNTVSI